MKRDVSRLSAKILYFFPVFCHHLYMLTSISMQNKIRLWEGEENRRKICLVKPHSSIHSLKIRMRSHPCNKYEQITLSYLLSVKYFMHTTKTVVFIYYQGSSFEMLADVFLRILTLFRIHDFFLTL